MRYHTPRHVAVALGLILAMLAPSLAADAATVRHAAGAPVYGGTLRVGFSEDFVTLDPAEASGIDDTTLYGTVFSGLYKFSAKNQPQIDLAAAQPVVSKDTKTWTFTLRKGVTFSNGTPLTASDVKYSLLRVLSPHLKPASPFQATDDVFVGSHDYLTGKATDISGIKVLDPYTIRFQTTGPMAILPYILAQTFNSVVSQALVSKQTQQQTAEGPVGSGPFMLQSWQKGVQAVFVKNPHYYRAGQPYLDKVVVSLNVTPSVIALKIQHGDLDAFGAAFEAASADIQQMSSDPKYSSYIVHAEPSIAIWLELNAHSSVMKSLALRQAIAMAIDRTRLVQLDGGNAVPMYQTFLPSYTNFDPAFANKPVYPYDPVKAAALLKQSGYHGQTLLYLDRSGIPYFNAIAPGIQQSLKQIGLNVQIKTVGRLPYHVIREQVAGHDLNPMDWGIDYFDGWDTYSFAMTCTGSGEGGFSGSHYCDPAADALATKAQTLPLGPARDALLRQAQRRILESATKIPLMYPKNTEIASPKIGGF
ncbi:MAG: extracellular solute-binding protein family 5, partial [Chloroflexi bacterium]|nr:extracellular solute-binding protein family 5 [Chloroflexota bacterium]